MNVISIVAADFYFLFLFFKVVSEGAQMPTQDQHSSLQTDPALLRRDTNYDFESSVNGQVIHPDYLNANISQGVEAHSVVQSSNVDRQVCYLNYVICCFY